MPYNNYGYTPLSFEAIMNYLMEEYNTQFGTTYTAENFSGTNAYKFFYSVAQRIYDSEVDTGEIFNKLQDYLRMTNEEIAIPKTPVEGLIKVFDDNDILISVKEMTAENAGTLSVCADVDHEAEDYATTKALIVELLALYTAAGLAFDGTESGNYTFSNGQVFAFSYHLPSITPIILRVNITISINNRYAVDSEAQVKTKILANLAAYYKLGNDFEPLKYFEINRDAPYAAEILLEWSDDDGSNWYSDIFNAEFDDKFVLENGADDITVTIG